jgi:hypothetical protein
MSILRTTLFSFGLFVGLFLSSCETDIDVVGPKRDLTVIYGVLDANQTEHIIRINKLFVGEDSASTLAAISGINEYTDQELSAKIVEYFGDGKSPTGTEWPLLPKYIKSKNPYDPDNGNYFASDSNKVYFFDAQLNPNHMYKLVCNVSVAGEDPKVVSAITNVLGNLATSGVGLEPLILKSPQRTGSNSTNGGADRTETEVAWVNNVKYATNFRVEWTATEGGVIYTSYIRLYYRDFDKNTGLLINKDSVTLAVGSRNFSGEKGAVQFPGVNAEEYYATIGNIVPDLDTSVSSNTIQRVVSDTLQFFVEVANSELSTYIEVNAPISNVVQERGEYTNVTNGIGIFASRLIGSSKTKDASKSGRILDNRSLEELLYSNLNQDNRYTADKSFTVPGRCVIIEATGPKCR